MLGGSAGQFAVAPLIHGARTWQQFWIVGGVVTVLVALLVLVLALVLSCFLRETGAAKASGVAP